MRKILLGALLAAAIAAPAAAQTSARLDPAQARTPAETLVLCDIAAFLKSDPDLGAWTIYVRRDTENRFDPLFGPDFLTGGRWYDEDYERTYRRLRRERKVSYQEVLEAQRRFGGQIGEIRYLRAGEARAFRRQDRACRVAVKAL